jgi:hypothetical protein
LHHQTALVRKTMRFITRHVVVVRVQYHLNHSYLAVSHWYTGQRTENAPPAGIAGGALRNGGEAITGSIPLLPARPVAIRRHRPFCRGAESD